MKTILRIVSATVVACFLLSSLPSCNDTSTQQPTATAIPYPQPLPDSTALIFLPGIVSKDSFDFNAAFSPDGRFYYLD